MLSINATHKIWYDPHEMAMFHQELIEFNKKAKYLLEELNQRKRDSSGEYLAMMHTHTLAIGELIDLNRQIREEIVKPVPNIELVKGTIDFFNYKLMMAVMTMYDVVDVLGLSFPE